MTTRLDIHNSEVPLLCRACEARHKGICNALSPEQLVRLSKETIKHTLTAGQEIPGSSDAEKRYANVLKGVVKLTKLTSDGRQQIVGLQFAPDFLGRPFSKQSDVSIEASTEVKVCSFPRRALDAMIKESPDLEHRLYEQTARELDEARDWILALGRKSAPERVATFLCFLADHIDPESGISDNKVSFTSPLKRAEIADFLGLTIETVSRQISKLRVSGIIKITDNRDIEIPDLSRLRALCETEER